MLAGCSLPSGTRRVVSSILVILARLTIFFTATMYRGISWLWRYWYRHVSIDDKYRGIAGIAQHYLPDGVWGHSPQLRGSGPGSVTTKLFRMPYPIWCILANNGNPMHRFPSLGTSTTLTEYVVCPHEYSLKNDGISIHSAVFAQYARVKGRQQSRQTTPRDHLTNHNITLHLPLAIPHNKAQLTLM